TAWTLLGVHYLLILTQELLFGTLVHLPGLSEHTLATLRAVLVVGANVAASTCAVMLARIWRAAGLFLPPPGRAQRGLVVSAMVLAIAVVGWGARSDLAHLAGGDLVVALAADFGDLVGFGVIAPLVLIALAMRGGSLAWPWGLITASYIAWLIYD